MTWRPVYEAHAIERATLTLNFQQEVPAKALHNAVELVLADIISLGFQPSVPPPPNNVLFLNLGQSPVPMAMPMVIEGRGFQIVRAGELIEEVVFQRSYIAYTTTRYTRWKSVIERIGHLIGPVVDRLIQIANIASLKVEYYDRFVFEGDQKNVDYRTVIKEKSRFVPDFYYETQELWHSHVGYFVKVPKEYQRLVNANVDVLDVMPKSTESASNSEVRRSVGIYTMAEDRFFTVTEPSPPNDIGEIFIIADDMHLALKDVLREVISPMLAESINLDAKGE